MLPERGELRHFIKDQVGLNRAEWALIGLAILLAVPLARGCVEAGSNIVVEKTVEVLRSGTSAIFDRLLDPTKYR